MLMSKINIMWSCFCVVIGVLCFVFGLNKGADKQIIKTVIEEREVIKTVYVKSNEIESMPNKNREELLNLMKGNKF